MLKYDPKLRLSAGECLTHTWFKINENLKNISPLSKTTIENMRNFKVLFMAKFRKKINLNMPQ